MRRKDRQILDKTTMFDVVKNGKYTVVGMCNNNEPYVVTLSYGFEEESETLFFHGAQEGQKLDFMRINPQVCMTVIEDNGYQYDHCTHAYKSVIIRGTMKLISSEEERMHAIKVMIQQLEHNPKEQIQKLSTQTDLWKNTQMFACKIEQISCKERIPLNAKG
jgi:nitroimidazol reductase NimA-like FMN-containing flavoprotein (pyridoxamine 5'-phosphate oxidase superfamily)